MTRRSRREIERKIEEIEQGLGADAADVQNLWIRSIRRAQGDVEDPLPDEEFDDLWNQAMEEYGSPWES